MYQFLSHELEFNYANKAISLDTWCDRGPPPVINRAVTVTLQDALVGLNYKCLFPVTARKEKMIIIR